MSKFKLIIKHLFVTAVALVVFPVMIYGWIDQFKNPEFHAPIILDYDKKQAELQQILDTITIGLPPHLINEMTIKNQCPIHFYYLPLS